MIIELANEAGLRARVLSCGACLFGLDVPDASGRMRDVVLGLPAEQDYLANDSYMGAVVGRCVNRIAGASFELDGRRYRLEANEGANCNHSGSDRWFEREWSVVEQRENRVVLSLFSPSGDQGFPGNLEVRASYTLEGRALAIELAAASDAATIVNLTSHAYYNLNGHTSGSVLGHALELAAEHYLVADEAHLPTGELRAVAGTEFDFRHASTLGARMPQGGYDHCFALDGAGMRHVGRLAGDTSGIVMDIETNQPGMQLYTANFLDNLAGKDGARYQAQDAVCLECAGFPDAIHHPKWPSVVVGPDAPYRSLTRLGFSVGAS